MKKRYWLNLLKFILLLTAGASLLLLGFVVYLTVKYTRQTLEPTRQAMASMVLETPHEHEPVVFTTSDGLTIRGWYFPSQNGAAIILGSGYGAGDPQLVEETNLLVSQGYGVLLFFWRGTGLSDGEMVTIGDQEQRDLKAALDWLSTRSDIDPARIGAMGFSMGGVVVAETAADDPRLKAVIIQAAFPTLEEVTHDKASLLGPLTQNIAEWTLRDAGIDLENVRAIDALCRISPRPVFLIYGSADEVIPPGTIERMEAAACEPFEFWVIEGAGHGGYMMVEGYAERIITFFDEALLRVSRHE